MNRLFFAMVIICYALFESTTCGQPGNFMPDVYYNPADGIVSIDTDGTDFTFVAIGRDLTANLILMDGGSLCDPPQFFTVGLANSSTQWIRTLPLTGPGPRGTFDLADGGLGLTSTDFPALFGDGSGTLWEVLAANSAGTSFFSNVIFAAPPPHGDTCVPEPTALCLGALSLLLFGGRLGVRKA